MYTIPHDKALHFIAGVLLFMVGNFIAMEVGLALGFAYAIGKEVWDKVSGKGHPEFMDFVYTVAGTVAGLLCAIG